MKKSSSGDSLLITSSLAASYGKFEYFREGVSLSSRRPVSSLEIPPTPKIILNHPWRDNTADPVALPQAGFRVANPHWLRLRNVCSYSDISLSLNWLRVMHYFVMII